jgi:hypothetical protein
MLSVGKNKATRCQSRTDDEGVVKIVDEDDRQGTRNEMDADGDVRDYGVIGVVEGSKIYSELKKNFNSSVESVPHRFFFPVEILTNG